MFHSILLRISLPPNTRRQMLSNISRASAISGNFIPRTNYLPIEGQLINDQSKLIGNQKVISWNQNITNKESNVYGTEIFTESLYGHVHQRFQNLDKMNYIDDPLMGWTHESLRGCIKMSTDHNLCHEMNKLGNGAKTAYWYINPRAKDVLDANWDNERIKQLMGILESWSMLKHAPYKYRDWLVSMASRVYAGFPNLSLEHNVLVAKWFMAAFITDDPIERLLVNDTWWSVGKKYLENINNIYSGNFNPYKNDLINMESYRGKFDIPDVLSDALVWGTELHLELESELRQTLHRDTYKLSCDWMRDFSNVINIEQPHFKRHTATGKYCDSSFHRETRQKSIGFFFVLGPLLNNNPKWTKILTAHDSLANSMAWLICLQNDIVSAPKEGIGKDFCPLSQCNYLMQSKGMDFLDTVKILSNENNELQKNIEGVIRTMDPVRRQLYEYLSLIQTKFVDYNWIVGLNESNTRYGWTPVIEI